MAEEKKGSVLGFDPDFKQRLAGEEPYRSPDSGDGWLDPRFAGLDVSGSGAGSRALKEFIAQEDAKAQGSSRAHLPDDIEGQVAFDGAQWTCRFTLAGKEYVSTAATRDECLSKAARFVAESSKPAFRELTEEEKLQVIRCCQAGDKLTGLGLFLRFAIGEKRMGKYDSPIAALSDPELLPVMNAACEFCWFHSHPGATNTPEWHEYKERVLAGRPKTFDLLDAIWLRYQDRLDEEKKIAPLRRLTAEPEPPTQREVVASLEQLSDADVERAMTATKREYVRAGLR